MRRCFTEHTISRFLWAPCRGCNAQADAQLRQCANRLAQVAAQAKEVGMLIQARAYLALALSIQPDVAQWQAWEQAW